MPSHGACAVQQRPHDVTADAKVGAADRNGRGARANLRLDEELGGVRFRSADSLSLGTGRSLAQALSRHYLRSFSGSLVWRNLTEGGTTFPFSHSIRNIAATGIKTLPLVTLTLL